MMRVSGCACRTGLGVIIVVALNACGAETPRSLCQPEGGLVTRILDGDTVELESGDKVRYLLVAAPEFKQCDAGEDNCQQGAAGEHECFGNEARELNRRLVHNREISITYDLDQCTGRYGRALGYVTVDDRMVNRILIERGYARVLVEKPENRSEDYVHQVEFLQLEDEARYKRRGLWGICP